MKYLKKLPCIILVCILLMFTSCNKESYDISITQPINGNEISMYDAKIKKYLELDNINKIAEFLDSDDNITKLDPGTRDGYVNNELDFGVVKKITWDGGNSPYTISFSNSHDMKNKIYSFESYGKSFSISQNLYFLKGNIYYYQITDANGLKSKVDSFTTDCVRQFIKLNKVYNVRDLGGITLSNGKTISYKKLFRGGNLDNIVLQDKDVLNKDLKIKTDLDLRGGNENEFKLKKLTDSIAEIEQFKMVSIKASYVDFWKDTLYKGVFEILADESNYPIYFHCAGGADRTGTVAFVIEALLGASYEDICKDYELTTFGNYGRDYTRWRNDIITVEGHKEFKKPDDFNNEGHYHVFDKMIYKFVDKYDSTALSNYSINKTLSGVDFSKAAKNYLIELGITENQINNIITINTN